MITITPCGGGGTIGGNKILLEDEAGPSTGGSTELAEVSGRLFFDFGTSFKVREKYFEEYLNPRPGAGWRADRDRRARIRAEDRPGLVVADERKVAGRGGSSWKR